MSGVKHTPGKWLAAAKPSSVVGWPVVAAPMGQVICDVAIINKKPDHIGDGEFSAYYAQVEANARLIAAAPDRHAVALELDRLMLVIDSAVRFADPTYKDEVQAMLRANKAAIARARGEQDGSGE